MWVGVEVRNVGHKGGGCGSNHRVAGRRGKRNDGIGERKLARDTIGTEIITMHINALNGCFADLRTTR